VKDILNLKTMQPFSHAEGRVCIDYTDPVTGKVKERIKGKNHVYLDSFQCTNWKVVLDNIGLHMTGHTPALDTAFPYLLGSHVGYGRVGAGSSGTYRGAYNTANSFLGRQNGITGISWKYQYDFTPTQVPGTVKKIALTNQFMSSDPVNLYYSESSTQWPFKVWKQEALINNYTGCTVEGRYSYTCSSGVVTKKDLWFNTSTMIDVSSYVGTSGTMYCGYATDTGCYYIANGSTKYVYKFIDEYVTYSASYNYTNMSTSSSYWGPFYVHSGIAYAFYPSNNYICVHDFVANLTMTSITIPNDSAYSTQAVYCGYTSTYGNLIVSLGYSENKDSSCIFDLTTLSVVGYMFSTTNKQSYRTPTRYPLSNDYIFGNPTYGYRMKTKEFIHNAAFCIYRVPDDAPTRPSGYGMTITYEVEVLW
jgi:hypothetical protein